MSDELDIIPIHVFCSSANRAEMLNGSLRAQGLAVKPLWCPEPNEIEGERPELVFFFADTRKPSIEEVAAYAQRHAAALIVIAREYDAEAASRAMAAGADDWIPSNHGVLLAAAVRRERARRREMARIQRMEQELERNRKLVEQQFNRSEDAIATVHEGIVIESNAAWARHFGYPSAQTLVGVPIMDLFAAGSQPALKRAIKKLHKQRSTQTLAELLSAAGDKQAFEIDLDLMPDEDESLLTRLRIRDQAANKPSPSASEAETESAGSKQDAQRDSRTEADSALLKPGYFAPLAARQLSQTQSGAVRALVFLQPANPDNVYRAFGAIGVAELGVSLGTTFSALLEAGDLATRSADTNLVALIARQDEQSLEAWIQGTLATLGDKIFEGGGYSANLGFAAGYVVVDRIRQLDALVRRATEITGDQAGSVTRDQAETVAVDIDDDSWAVLIREALEDHRYTVALCPTEDLASGERGRVASPRLLDRAGQEIVAASFQPPALQLGLLSVLEHRLVGNALRALLKSRDTEKFAYIIAPLHANSLTDKQMPKFLGELFEHTSNPPPPKSLILELDVTVAADKLREAEKFAKRIQELDCAFGLRNYAPGSAADKLIKQLPIECLRLAPDLTDRLMEEDELSARLAAAITWLKQHKIRTIATQVGDSATMARLYNLGLSTIQGPIIGEPELLASSHSEERKNPD